MCSKFVMVSFALVALVVCESDEDLYDQQRAAIKAMPCGTPQPRVISWEDIFAEEEKPLPCEIMLPHVSVLHRCDFASGCCEMASKSCQPVATQPVTLVYKIFRISSKFSHSQCADNTGPKTRYIHVEAVNHTQCACKSKRNQPK